MSDSPKVDHADRDLDSDGRTEIIVVDRAMCTADGNCYWNVFRQPREASECARYAGTFAGASARAARRHGRRQHERRARATGNSSGGRLLLQSYRFVRDGYRIDDVLQCKRAPDDRLDCADTNGESCRILLGSSAG